MSEQKPSHEVEGIVCRAPRQDCVETQIWGRVQQSSAALKVPRTQLASIILKWKKFGTTKILPRAGRLAKLSNRWRRALVRENLPEGQQFLQYSTNQAFMVEWPDGSHSSVKGT
ncbi:unnamed protein product [Oncorhynchus mykiss]|uniref:Transposase Tc1-like domain-containing protein n=1 Tax=Oncorhynchus mykiss TaxID=8022 RepID=A0A061A0N2_ONCMY|nr:unnamed protein product [Oncorhynchus mykiss]